MNEMQQRETQELDQNAEPAAGLSNANRRYTCSVEATLDVIGGKWKGIIVFHLLNRMRRFNELRRLMPSITQRMLTLQLRELEENGIVHREVYKEVPPRVEYSLTPFGLTLRPIIMQMMEWGRSYEMMLAEREEGLDALSDSDCTSDDKLK
ncbi:transcriptional regulator, HxlR family [Paenibacillus curdlanolyticus YK9]|uniref:Transcriptional regulator, HxlR family n=1 Tax=Paenibacillus curdlanolyticus YK9 TaxID=717606 RepID=E0IGK0_9BACL|nr:helix-turn-helix domain-containing protein [Paenibacillus curdlanolyticus]EFM08404.1 transcriptional regulator, HxlR family [Paenibacillus curdlanolyticus YK9]